MNAQQASLFGSDQDHALARPSDPITSQSSDTKLRQREGRANEIRKGTHRHQALLAFLKMGARTADEVQIYTGINGIWKRVSDLKNMGFIEPTGRTRPSRQGRDQEVLRITDAGLSALVRLGDIRLP